MPSREPPGDHDRWRHGGPLKVDRAPAPGGGQDEGQAEGGDRAARRSRLPPLPGGDPEDDERGRRRGVDEERRRRDDEGVDGRAAPGPARPLSGELAERKREAVAIPLDRLVAGQGKDDEV